MIKNLTEEDSIVSHWMTQLRDCNIQKDRDKFRRNIEKIGEILAYEISKNISWYNVTYTRTPIEGAFTKVLKVRPVIVSILRAGIPLYNGIINVLNDADSAFVGSYRRENGDIEIVQEYVSKPSIQGRPLIIADTMLATGSSIISALKELLRKETPSEIHIACVIAAPEGIKKIKEAFPNINIWAASIDKCLNEKNYIVPGLGDAGDLCFGTKL
jgi:uracil phosphoribosyltransferase